MIVDILLTVAQVFVFLYDVVTYPIYQVVGRINNKQKVKSTTPRAYMVKESSEEIRWRRDKSNDNAVYKEIIIDNQVGWIQSFYCLQVLSVFACRWTQ